MYVFFVIYVIIRSYILNLLPQCNLTVKLFLLFLKVKLTVVKEIAFFFFLVWKCLILNIYVSIIFRKRLNWLPTPIDMKWANPVEVERASSVCRKPGLSTEQVKFGRCNCSMTWKADQRGFSRDPFEKQPRSWLSVIKIWNLSLKLN